MSTISKSLFILALLRIISLQALAADKKTETQTATSPLLTSYLCSSNIYYTWQPTPPPPPTTQLSEQGMKGKKGSSQPIPTPQPVKPIEEFSLIASEKATTEQLAKELLTLKLPGFEAKALKDCEQKHQASADCMATKFKAFDSEYKSVDFELRRTLLESMKNDCLQALGKCISTRTADITCRKEETTTTSSPTPTKEEKKK